jgi:peptide deformylase
MSILKVITGSDNPILLTMSDSVTKVDRSIKGLILDMKDTLSKKNGLGLAAPQVGKNIRVILVALQKGVKLGEDYLVLTMINPEILSFSEETDIAEEGCLSLPKLFLPVRRSVKIKVRFENDKGVDQVLVLEGINARIVQHEVDHLNGILITQRNAELNASLESTGLLM